MATPIKPRERDAIMQALRAGVVPRVGLQHIQVGRSRETEEMAKDIERIRDGGASVRFVIGDYGSGKTFFLTLVRLMALQRGAVVLSADLAPDRRFHSTGGYARSLVRELTRNAATRSKPGGGALASVLERFVSRAVSQAEEEGRSTGEVIRARLKRLEDLSGGYDFATVVGRYWEGHESGDEHLQANALRWLRGEFETRTDARSALGVRHFVSDDDVYDHLKLLAVFVRTAGYDGLLVAVDEMVNLYRIAHGQSRRANYEQLLRVVNDVLQGNVSGLGFVMGGTPAFLTDTRRGLYSYEALQTRLAENRFGGDGLVDVAGPVLRLAPLAKEDLYVLLGNVRRVFLGEKAAEVPDDAITAFMTHCAQRLGDAYFRTPRNTVKAFAELLAVLAQNPGARWQDLIGDVKIAPDEGADGANDGDELASFRL